MSHPTDPALRQAGDPASSSSPAIELERLLLESVVDYAIFALDASGRVVTWNAGGERLKGYAADEILGRHFSQFYAEEDVRAGKPARALEVAARTGRFEDEGWRVRKGGSRFWASVVITPLRDPRGGALIGFAKVTRDLTARREAEERSRELALAERRSEEMARLTEALRQKAAELESQYEESQTLAEEAQSLSEELETANEELYSALARAETARAAAADAESFSRSILESIADPFVVQDRDWRFRYVNEAAARILARSKQLSVQELIGRSVWEIYPELLDSAFEREMHRAASERTPRTFEAFYPERGEWMQMFCYPLPDGGLATQWKNITQRKQAEESARFLARASQVLGASLDDEATLGELARLVVPDLADWCGVEMAGEDGTLRQVAVAHVDPDKVAFARELSRRYPPDPNATTGVPQVLRTGQPVLYPEISDDMLIAGAVDADHLQILRALGLRSAMVVPLAARDRTLGALTLVSAESRRRYGDGDLALAMELGRRAGIAVDNARLYGQARAATERTQRLQAVTAGLARALNADEVADTVIHEGVAALGAVDGVLCLRTSAGDELEIVRAVGLDDETVRTYHRFRMDAPLPLSEAVRTGEPVFLEGKRDVVAHYPMLREPNERAATEAWIALPLVVGAEVVGGLAFGFSDARRFAHDDREFASALAQQCALALERARLYAAEQEARAEAEQANRAKAEFLASMSHELRTPLNAIAGYAELLILEIHGPLTDAQRDTIGRMQRSERHLLALINDILNFARIEAGHLALTLAEVPLRDLIASLEPLVAPQLRARALAFDFESCDAALVALADPEKVRQILLNLLSNAIKFTPPGGRLSVAGEQDGEYVRVSVRDTGMGIPGDKLERIFEPFVQLDRSLTIARDGAGLGLAISRDLARAMGGELIVESAVGAGSTFTLLLPRPEK